MSADKPTRRLDGKPETDADKRFFQLRDSGYRGPIDHHGYAIPEGRDAEYLRSITGGV